MRTTLALDDDAIEAIQAYAASHHLSLGKAASDLIRRGSRYQLGTRKVNGLPVLEAPNEFPVITTARVRELLDEE
jgi:negative regulator of replication initiation